jgi:methyl coenzyme M reductase gamma subunit
MMLNPDSPIQRAAIELLSPREPAGTGRESREDCIKKDLTLRLKGACEHLSKLDFEVLVSDMTREQLRGESVHGRRIRPS